MELYKATSSDIDILIDLRLEYLRMDMGDVSEVEELMIRKQVKAYLEKYLPVNDFIAIMAKVDGEVAATAYLAISEKPANLVFLNGRTGTVLNVMTFPKYRRQGIATKVMKELLLEAKKAEVSTIDLNATEDGKYLYEKLGFQEPRCTAMRLQLVT
jgi:ribosomal protein S18 acetylase RimI-like enzyme